jgi:hypothetical protein
MKKKINIDELKKVLKEEISREFGDIANDDDFDYSFLNSDMSGTYGDSEQEEINQDELFKKTDEIGEFTGFIYSNVDSIRDVLNNNFKEDSQAKTEILDALNVIEEQINVIASKVYELR